MALNSTKAEFEEELNHEGVPASYRRRNGGDCRNNTKFGTWLRRNRPEDFNERYDEFRRNN